MRKTAYTLLISALICCRLLASDRPNILWLTSEDNNVNWVGAYGNPHADTPNLDQLAKDGFLYTNCYANAPVCAPSRSTWITGMLAISNGTHPMRSRYEIPHDRIPYYPDLMRANGYYVANDKKTDFNIGGRDDSDCWDHHGKIQWNELKKNQPFFQVLNHTESHESKAFGSVEKTTHNPANTNLRAYHPDIPTIRKNYAHYHDAVKRMDARIGAALAKLEALGLADNTIVVYVSDHGGVLPRSKRFLFQSGLHCPLIIRIPESLKHLYPAEKPGTQIEELISFVDMPKTWLSLTGSEIPETMQGRVFLGPDSESPREYHFAFRGRMDGRIDNARAMTDGDFLYIRNYMPYVPWMQHLSYLWRMEATQAWEAAFREGLTDEVQSRFFMPKGTTEELYDMQADPDNINNLASDPKHAATLERMRSELRRQQLEYFDSGLIPESELVKLSRETGKTAYDVVRDPALYNLPELLDAADLALEAKPENIPALETLLQSEDVALRYWGMVGCFLLDHAKVAEAAMQDPSDEVKAMAAWMACKHGDFEAGLQTLVSLIRGRSYASLTALNIIDWMGEAGRPILDALEDFSFGNGDEFRYETRVLSYLSEKY